MPQFVSQLFMLQIVNGEEKIVTPCENNGQSVAI